MGIYKVIKIKLPKWIQNKKNITVGVHRIFVKKFKNTGNKKVVTKKRPNMTAKKRKKRSYKTVKIKQKRHKKALKKENIHFKYIIIALFCALLFVKCFRMFTVQKEQSESQNANIVTETKQNFLLQDGLPY